MKKPVALEEWQEMFSKIYGKRNSSLSVAEVWLRVVEEVGKLAEALRKESKKEIVRYLPATFAWWCGFCTRIGIKTLTWVIWRRFPNACPYCLREENCTCVIVSKKSGRSLTASEILKKQAEKMPLSLDELQQMFARIYGPVNKVTTQTQTGLHIMEEIGEVAKELRLGQKEKLEEELADVLAWICGLATRAGLNLSKISWKKYPRVCPFCKKEKCSC